MIATILRKTNDFKGKQRLSRLMLRTLIRDSRDLIVQGKYNCEYKVPNLKEVIGFELFINGVFEDEHIQFIISKLPQGGTFIDLGANIGSISVPICKLRPDIQTFSIEASPQIANYLTWNVEHNKIANCIIEQKAIWKESGQYVSFIEPIEQYGKGMIDLKSHILKQEKIATISIDSFCQNNNIKKVDFIKVDIEGFEYFAFRGGITLLKGAEAPDILFEFIKESEMDVDGLEPGDAQALLISYGYQLYQLENNLLKSMEKPLTNGFAMIFATKKK